MIVLPDGIRERATFRILWMPEGQWTAAGGQPWQVLPVPAILDRTKTTPGVHMAGTVLQGGYHVERITRWCLPDEDRASFYIDTGTINGVSVTALDLSGLATSSPGCAIRIQVLDDETFPNGVSTLPTGPGSKWKTVFAGTVISQQSIVHPSLSGAGRTTYHCAGVLWRTRNWPLDRHTTAQAPHAKGHPGYNFPLRGYFRQALGNLDYTSTGYDPFGDISGANGYPDIHTYYMAHQLPVSGGDTSKWTDLAAVKHALASSRAVGEPIITVSLPADAFGGTYPWSVSPGDSCWDLLRRICNRQRGRGAVFLDYVDAADPGGNLTLVLSSFPSFPDQLTYQTVATYGDTAMTGTATIQGAQRGTSAIDIDINNDHRITDDGLTIENRTASVMDMIVVQGEPIQVLANLNFFGSSLEERWSAGDQTTFAGIGSTPFLAAQPRWSHVWRRYGIPAKTPWTFTVTAKPGGSATPIDYDCANDGSITSAGVPGTTVGLSSSLTVRVLPDLPIYEGYRYDQVGVAPSRWDGGVDYMPPNRMRPVVMYRGDTDATGAKQAWLPLQFAGFSIQADEFGLYITHPVEDISGYRLLSDTTNDPNHYQPMEKVTNCPMLANVTTTSGVDRNKLNTIVGLELGTRVGFRYSGGGMSGDYKTMGRRMVLTIDGAHLWLAPAGAIWELDYSAAAQLNYSPGLTVGTVSGTYIMRDDRTALSFVACLAWYYYGSIHNPAIWSLKDCGLMTQFATADAGNVKYPKLGQFVGSITHSGPAGSETKTQSNTPITCIDYMHEAGVTTWRTDYVAYDGNAQ